MKYFFSMLLFLGPIYAAQVQPARNLDRLISRAEQFWRLQIAGQRLKAGDHVIPSKRERFLNQSAVLVAEPRIIGVDFTEDRSAAVVRLAVKLVGGGTLPMMTDWVISDRWVWENGNWFLDLNDSDNPFRGAFKGNSTGFPQSAANRDQLEKSFKLLTDRVNVGTVWIGEYPLVEIGIEYTGDSPVRIESELDTPLVALDFESTRQITRGTSSFKIKVYAEDHEGPFRLPLPLRIFYKDVDVRRTLVVEGTILSPLSFRQIPETFQGVGELELFIRNNTDQSLEVRGIHSDASFDVLSMPRVLPPQEERAFRLFKRPDKEFIPKALSVEVTPPLRGKNFFHHKLRVAAQR